MRRIRFLALLALAAAAPLIAAEPNALRDAGDSVHLFGYTPTPGHEAQFDAGYQKHLAWHREHADPLVWYGWTITHGPRMGMFVDGTFGAPFAAFDRRVAPADDAKDAERTFLPHGTPAFRSTWRVRRDLSAGTPLEQWQPTSMVEVHHYKLRAGRAERFERIAKRMKVAFDAKQSKVPYTWYEGVGGTGSPEYMLMIARDGWASFDAGRASLEGVLQTVDDATVRQQLLDGYAAAVDDVASEIWRYRSEMSLIPGR